MLEKKLVRAAIVSLVAVLPVLVVAQHPVAKAQDAATLRTKVDAIQRHAESNSRQARDTVLSEAEVNAYLAFDGKAHLPTGLTDPYIEILDGGRLSATAVIDLDLVRDQRKSRGWLDPLAYLSGTVGVVVAGTFDARDGAARFILDTARLGGVPIPKNLVQELVTFYSRTE